MPAYRKPPGQALGHRRHDFVVLDGGQTAPAIPRPPGGLLVATERRWDAFWRSGVSQVIDLDADMPRLHRWIRDSDEFTRVDREIRRVGRLVVGSMGQPVLNPLYGLLRELDDRLRRAEAAFGMTPMDRLRLGLTLAETKLAEQRVRKGEPPVADRDRRAAILAEADADAEG
jgi:hypothetical protein